MCGIPFSILSVENMQSKGINAGISEYGVD